MKVSGNVEVEAAREAVWDALRDVDVLRRTVPGCEGLRQPRPGVYTATATAGAAGARGTYRATAEVTDRTAPVSCRVTVDAAGEPGTVRAVVLVDLEEDGAATVVRYTADAVVTGRLTAIGQRTLAGVARRVADDFFDALARDLQVGGAAPAPPPTAAGSAEASPSGSRRSPRGVVLLVVVALAGAVLALVGVLVRRRRR